MNVQITYTLLLTQLVAVLGGRILVFPLDGSHWINMKIIIEQLHGRGHVITVIRPPDSWYISEESPLYTSVNLPSPGGFEDILENLLSDGIEALLQSGSESYWSEAWNEIKFRQLILNQMSELHKKASEELDLMFSNETLMRSFEDAKYDVVLTDPGIGGGAMLARWLKVPLVFNVRWTIQGEGHFLIAPSPLSYIPFTATEYSDKMTFPQRTINILKYLIGMYTVASLTEPYYKPVVQRYFGPDVDYSTFNLDADIWLMRNDFIFEFPRPTMPNIVYMGGFQCKPAKQLPADLEEFVRSSGDHGFIIMSLGTLVKKLPQKITQEIAAAFAELPQKVIWKYGGPKPANLGNNTLLVDWFPQNDLLGHPKIRAFVAHGGTNGVQEAIYHGVPIVGLPVALDQPDNLSRIKAKGGAINLHIGKMDRRSFGEALRTIIHNPSYRENMQRLSKLQRDQPMKPLDKAVFWIEYVMRHKGAPHLKSESFKMSWVVYNCIDVIAALLALFLCIIFSSCACIRFLWRLFLSTGKNKQE
ncbi:UDP-glucuronosyltransferase 2C1-like [Synchiropus splendidus]|uniref:UDP-glucuronosyltransferase 2C1-like n=1 Tax=Synchiropus splendidus TaxID=270530 RepID=UPI00237D37E3|nr:UDP-glucuronosyltransferase 2C1-like [Synchiropus splendidus]XP_053741175.1 UDP-glucuronosyltransferase 2C1-like [Synchiropus splendidus]XP_053741176.1 UDP-glucuronosyltransferase 2C1-like [Synchiropus splendidus]XP_053741177.1 UDP-glucuronosyltransferase 2C1-like [Synchiropus splendidus]XP_053741178.1 UDP-glucuronosyltransferase 2C1-like [Synchiropus splendidus]